MLFGILIAAAGQSGLKDTESENIIQVEETDRVILESDVNLDWEYTEITSQTTMTMTWEGESIANISDQYGISVEALAEVNDFPLTWGDTITLPNAILPTYYFPLEDPESSRVTQDFSEEHPAIDIAGPLDSPVVSVAPGIVRYASWQEEGYGFLVVVDHDNGYSSWYAHLDSISVSVGDLVDTGDEKPYS